jgi:hypothetical protein
MATETDHVRLANRNHATLGYLMQEADTHPEWVATVAFYKAVHVVEAVFAANLGQHSSTHKTRMEALKMARFREIHKHFRPLYSASRIARYLEDGATHTSVSTFTSWMPANAVVEKLVRRRLRAVENACLDFLSDGAKSVLLRVDTLTATKDESASQ